MLLVSLIQIFAPSDAWTYRWHHLLWLPLPLQVPTGQTVKVSSFGDRIFFHFPKDCMTFSCMHIHLGYRCEPGYSEEGVKNSTGLFLHPKWQFLFLVLLYHCVCGRWLPSKPIQMWTLFLPLMPLRRPQEVKCRTFFEATACDSTAAGWVDHKERSSKVESEWWN